MKLLVVSDSHGDLDALRRAVRFATPDMLLHLGDHCADADALERECLGLPILSVRGNCDYGDLSRCDRLLREVEGVRIFAAHGHLHGVKMDCTRFLYAAREQQAQLAFFGHTHIPYLREHFGVWLMNPGACSGRNPTFGIVTLENGSVTCRIEKLFSEETL